MATLGLTKLEAVNRMLRSVNQLPVAALDTAGTSIAAFAEQVLDEASTAYQARGLDENTVYGKAYTANGSGIVTVASGVLNVKGSGPQANKRVTLRSDVVWNLSDDTNNWGNGATIYLDVITEVTFVDLTPASKEAIANEATVIFQRRYRGSPDQDGYTQQEAMKAGFLVAQPAPMVPLSKPVPMIGLQQPQQ